VLLLLLRRLRGVLGLEDVKCACLLSLWLRLAGLFGWCVIGEKCVTTSPRVLVPVRSLGLSLSFVAVSKRPVLSAFEELIFKSFLHKVVVEAIFSWLLLHGDLLLWFLDLSRLDFSPRSRVFFLQRGLDLRLLMWLL